MGGKRIVGKCSICGGIVSVPTVSMSVVPTVPTCESCGASEDQTAHLPVVPMTPRDHTVRRPGRETPGPRWSDNTNVRYDGHEAYCGGLACSPAS